MKKHWKAISICLTLITLPVLFFITSTIVREHKEQVVVEVRPDSQAVDLGVSEKPTSDTTSIVAEPDRDYSVPPVPMGYIYQFRDGRIGYAEDWYHYSNDDADISILRVVDGWLTQQYEDAWSFDIIDTLKKSVIKYDVRDYEEAYTSPAGLDTLRAHWPVDLVPKTMRHPLFGDEQVMEATLTAAKGPRPIAFSTDVMRVARKFLKVEDEKLVSNFKRFRLLYNLMGRPEWARKKIEFQIHHVDQKIGTADIYQFVLDGYKKVWAFTDESWPYFYLPYSELVMRRARQDNLLRWEKIKVLLNEGLLAESDPDWDGLLVKIQAIKTTPVRRGKLVPMKG